MKSPGDIAARLRRQWQRRPFRLSMLTSADAWPMRYAIGLPSANDLATSPSAMREHAERWQRVSVGEVLWRDMNYRASADPIQMPAHWVLARPSDWIRAAADRQVASDFSLLEGLTGQVEAALRDTLIAELSLLQGRSREELQEVVRLAETLQPGAAEGRPLRLLAGLGVDTKFLERNRRLLTALLDARFGGAASEQGLHDFLDATPDGEHWLLLVPLQRGMLPFDAQQVRAQELATLPPASISARRILVVENRQCRHLLPILDDTLAILGTGLDLDWLKADWLDDRQLAYWGDIDTWGLAMLARVRQHRPQATALLMDRETFDRHAPGSAVMEPVGAGDSVPDTLTPDEAALYRWLQSCERGRLEQEFLPAEVVRAALVEWVV